MHMHGTDIEKYFSEDSNIHLYMQLIPVKTYMALQTLKTVTHWPGAWQN